MTEPPIICISANPALDRRIHLAKLSVGKVIRARSAQALPGGKAAHVAMAARALGANAIWLGFLGGVLGDECARELRKLEIEVVPILTNAPTRINLELIEDSGQITEMLEPGGLPTPQECEEMLRTCATGLQQKWKGALLVISGSLPAGMASDLYPALIEVARAAGSKVFLDTSGQALQKSLAARPDLIKPNRDEAEALLGKPVHDFRSAGEAAQELINRGAQSAAVTLGAGGIIWVEKNGSTPWIARVPRLNAVSTVGCGDAALAGFAWASLQGKTNQGSLKLAAACGAANCLAELPGRISLADVDSLTPQVKIDRA